MKVMDKLYKFEDFVEDFVDESISEKDKEWLWLGWQAAWNARVPEGYVVVPREPTEKIVKASCPWPHDNNSCINMIRSEYKTAYKAMIAAVEEENE